ncbi:ComF family protein [Corynebacterium mayonis]|uniref:ComF family protein n=1 Tax=Corynebacterium mayonis TaxID=3062461 RepID=UPI003140628A
MPVFAFGPYADAHRGVVLSMKEQRNLALRAKIGAVLAAGIEYLQVRGDIPPGVVLVPAPTRAAAARSRGGDPVEAFCRASGYPVWPGLSLAPRTTDQSTLTAQERRANLAGNVLVKTRTPVPSGPLIVVDDVVTTGATLQVSVEKLLACGGDVVACLALCAA